MPRYIDADVLRAVFTEKSTENVCGKELCKAIISRIDQIPTADVVPVKRGKWIIHPEVKNIYGGTYIECSECREKYVVQYIDDEKFCRNCGAKMEGDRDGV